ncbi:MAG: hypothetical protein LH473_07865 [Chitinophagales bacterium]|nr:hypothetical protein [Chitinophagales bacterium]
MKTLTIILSIICCSFNYLNAQDIISASVDISKRTRFDRPEDYNKISVQLFQSPIMPYDETGFIQYEVSGLYETASIVIFDSKEHVVKEYEIDKSGNGYVTLFAGTLRPGIYRYALKVNNAIAERRIITIIH